MYKSIVFLAFASFAILGSLSLHAQNTLGLLHYEPSKSSAGYNLIYPHNQPNVYLIDGCGQVVHVWTDEEQYRPGNTSYILEDGRLLKTKRLNDAPVTDPIWAGGGGAIVELRDWDNSLLWSFEQNDALRRLHHDIAPMPNGHVLMISWEYKSMEEAITAGRDPERLLREELWPDYILEVDPLSDEVVWEWHAWDHLVQDFDASKDNYGVVAERPERIDINYETSDGHPDWLHVNAIDYNAELDQILISVPTFSEVWIIDHSTTTEEAAGSTGGNSGKGGDLLYRWGNPKTYRQGGDEDQRLFYPHDIHWVAHPNYAGAIAAFNNRVNPVYSSVNLFTPNFDEQTSQYPLEGEAWGPADFDLTVLHPDTFSLSSSGLSSVQVLPNENLLICSGRQGYSFELTPEREVVWEYKTPLQAGLPVAQGTELGLNANLTFRIKRYSSDYSAFEGRDLTPQGYLELEPNVEFCEQLSTVAEVAPEQVLEVFPNPTSGLLFLDWPFAKAAQVKVYNLFGQQLESLPIAQGRNHLALGHLKPGLYLLSVQGKMSQKVLLLK